MNFVESLNVQTFSSPNNKDYLKVFFLSDYSHLDNTEKDILLHGFNQHTAQNTIRCRQQNSIRYLLDYAGITASMAYSSNGKPFIEAGPHISVSHTGKSIALSISSMNHGLDIEVSGTKAFKVRTRFCHGNELLWAERLNEPDIFTAMWSVKEAIFKYFGERVDFREHIDVQPFDLSASSICACYNGVHGNVVFNCSYIRSDQLHMVIARSAGEQVVTC